MLLTQILQKIKSAFYTKAETDNLLSGKSNTNHNHNSAYLGIKAKAESAKSADSVAWANVSGKPTIPTVNNATLTIQKNGTTVKTFTANSSANVTANITVPTKTSELTNNSGYITSSGSCNYANSAGSAPANGGTSTASAYLNGYETLQYGVNRLQYFNISTPTASGAGNIANPTNDWYYHIIQSHGNPNGYYFDIASHFHSNSVYYRRIASGAESGWIKFIDSDNIGSQSVNYANSAGNSDTVDGSHAWQMQTLNAGGSTHGSGAWLMQCQHNVDGDNLFKLYVGDKSIGTKVDRAVSADSATNATYANWLRTSSHSDHLFHTEWDGGYFWTYVTAGDGSYRAVRVARSDSAAYAERSMNNGAFYISGYQIYVG